MQFQFFINLEKTSAILFFYFLSMEGSKSREGRIFGGRAEAAFFQLELDAELLSAFKELFVEKQNSDTLKSSGFSQCTDYPRSSSGTCVF